MSSLIFIRHQRDLARDVLRTNADLTAADTQIAALNADKPPPLPKVDPVLVTPQDATPKKGFFKVPWWDGCLVLDAGRITYKEREAWQCDNTLVRAPLEPFPVNFPQKGYVNDAFVIKSDERYVDRDFKFTTDPYKAVKLRRDPASGTIEVVVDDNKPRPCWNIRSKKLYEEKDRTKNKTCAYWEIP
jgi:hypothetical protein